MEFYKKAKEIIDMDMDVMEFAGGASKDEIEYAMAELSVTFPASYQAFWLILVLVTWVENSFWALQMLQEKVQ